MARPRLLGVTALLVAGLSLLSPRLLRAEEAVPERPPGEFLVDADHVFTGKHDRFRLEGSRKHLADTYHVELAILGARPPAAERQAFARRVWNAWGLGDRSLLIVVGSRNATVLLAGDRLAPVLTPEFLAMIASGFIDPGLARAGPVEGIGDGLPRLYAELENLPPDAPPSTAAPASGTAPVASPVAAPPAPSASGSSAGGPSAGGPSPGADDARPGGSPVPEDWVAPATSALVYLSAPASAMGGAVLGLFFLVQLMKWGQVQPSCPRCNQFTGGGSRQTERRFVYGCPTCGGNLSPLVDALPLWVKGLSVVLYGGIVGLHGGSTPAIALRPAELGFSPVPGLVGGGLVALSWLVGWHLWSARCASCRRALPRPEITIVPDPEGGTPTEAELSFACRCGEETVWRCSIERPPEVTCRSDSPAASEGGGSGGDDDS